MALFLLDSDRSFLKVAHRHPSNRTSSTFIILSDVASGAAASSSMTGKLESGSEPLKSGRLSRLRWLGFRRFWNYESNSGLLLSASLRWGACFPSTGTKSTEFVPVLPEIPPSLTRFQPHDLKAPTVVPL